MGIRPADFRITAGLTGTWWGGLARDGEGWLIDIANIFFAAFYTYTDGGDHAWVVGAAGLDEIDGNMVTVTVFVSEPPGPSFGADFVPTDNVVEWGTAKFTFTSCTQGTVELMPNAAMIALGYEAITLPLERLSSPQISCPGTG